MPARNVPILGDDQSHGELGDGARVAAGRIEHRDAGGRGRGHVDVDRLGAAAADRPQPRQLLDHLPGHGRHVTNEDLSISDGRQRILGTADEFAQLIVAAVGFDRIAQLAQGHGQLAGQRGQVFAEDLLQNGRAHEEVSDDGSFDHDGFL